MVENKISDTTVAARKLRVIYNHMNTYQTCYNKNQ